MGLELNAMPCSVMFSLLRLLSQWRNYEHRSLVQPKSDFSLLKVVSNYQGAFGEALSDNRGMQAQCLNNLQGRSLPRPEA